ncbi:MULTISPECIES: hypothetical protein [unclassified Cryobacterium]|uniref:hypothetical protein n=1 Tax=unclassified Cryobacterium TaxID=2649013 RepID=UPI000CE54831|nr:MULTISPECIES: hypothetical protein [unclassified Cryobacterium]TFC69972.1 hypothetical protein E3O54_04580 [Cryobacterium sp. TMT2-4]
MTTTPDPNQPPNEPPNPPFARPLDDQPTDAVTSVTAAPDPAPAEPEGHGESGHEVEVETTRAAPAHTVACPSPIPDYAMEPSVEPPATAQAFLASDPPFPVAPVPTARAAAPTAAAAEPAYPEASMRLLRRPLFSTIVWGVILLALAGYVLLGVLVPAPADPTLWLLGGVIVIGLLLIVVGIIAALRRAG